MQIQVSGLAAENQRLNDKLRVATETHTRTTRSLEMQLKTTEQQLDMSKNELDSLQTEFNGYKVSLLSEFSEYKVSDAIHGCTVHYCVMSKLRSCWLECKWYVNFERFLLGNLSCSLLVLI